MRIVLDTNVFNSGIFFTGPPYEILHAWRDEKLQLMISPAIFEEYRRVAEELSSQFSEIDIDEIIDLVLVKAEMVKADELSEAVSADADDDKFLACAIASATQFIVSGDKHLLDISSYRDVKIIEPRQFVDELLGQKSEE